MSRKLIGIGIVVIALAAGTFIGIPLCEKWLAATIKTNLAKENPPVYVETVEVALLKRQVVLGKLRTSPPQVGMLHIGMEVDSMTMSGFALSDLIHIQSLETLLVNSLEMYGAKIDYTGMIDGVKLEQTVSLESVVLKDMQYDPLLYKKQPAAFFRSIKVGSMEMLNYNVTQTIGELSTVVQTQSCTMTDLTLLNVGKSSWKGITTNSSDKKLGIDSISIDSIQLPDIIDEVFALSENTATGSGELDKFIPLLWPKLKERPFVLNKLAITSIKELPLSESILGKLLFSVEISDQNFTFNASMDNLAIPLATLEAAGRMVGLTTSIFKNPLDLSAKISLSGTNHNGKTLVALKDSFIADNTLGTFALGLELVGESEGTPSPWNLGSNPRLKKAYFREESKVLTDIFFEAQASMAGSTPAEVREMYLEILAEADPSRTASGAELDAALEKMLREGGGIEVEMNFKEPLALLELDDDDEMIRFPESWGVTTKYLPPMK